MSSLEESVVKPVLLTSGIIIGIKTMDRLANTYYCRKCHKRHQKNSKIGKSHKTKKSKRKKSKKRRRSKK